MNCIEAERLETLYTTGDLDPKTMAEFDLHVSQCGDCSLRWKESSQVDALLRDAMMAEPVDASAVTARVREQMGRVQPRPTGWRHKLTFALGSLVLTLVIASVALIRTSHAPTLYTSATEDHIAEVVDHAPRTWTTGTPQIEQMVQQHVALRGLVQALAPEGYHIEHAMICPLSGRRYAHLVYSNGTREVSFFIGQKGKGDLPGRVIEHANGFSVKADRVENLQVAGFQTNQFTVMVVGDVPLQEAISFLVRAASVV